MPTINRERLLCTSRGHNKEYVLELEDNHGRYRVVGRYGRIGTDLVEAVKYNGTSLRAATAAYTKVHQEKVGKGYVVEPSYTRSTPAPDYEPQLAPTRPRVRTPASEERPKTVEFYDDQPRMITL